MKIILYSDSSWTFLKLITLAGLVATLCHGDVIASPHITPSYDVAMQICSGGVKTTP